MSAIAGIIHLDKEPVPFENGRDMMKSFEKFPADDIQVYHTNNAFIGNHAQWITPESIGEQQPFYDSERQCVITTDAIIDNREELFEKLQIDRSKQKNMTDSNLILLAYYKWGEESPKYLVGDFAYMIWDEKNRKLFGARDFSGYRTLYYFQDNKRFSFSSTIEAILSLPYIKKELNEDWLAQFLAISGPIDTVDAYKTPFKGIYQVPPAHSISVTESKTELKRYCRLSFEKEVKFRKADDYIEAFSEIFQEAVDSRLRTFRKVGSQLSGGLDSGAVVSFASKSLKKTNKEFHTFSYIPPKDFVDFTPKQLMPDERRFIKATVEHVGGITDHYLDFEGRNTYTEIDGFTDVMEMPYKFFENSFWLKGIIEAAHEQGIGVLLNGDRGNFSVSWGSALDYYSTLLKRLKWIKLYRELDQFSNNVGGPRLRRLPRIIEIGFPLLERIRSISTTDIPPAMISAEFARKTKVFTRLGESGIDNNGWFSPSNIYDERKMLYENTYPWNHGNTFTSKMSLRHKIWKRDPTNDLRVVKFCLSLPENQFVKNGVDRALIRHSTEGYLPSKVRLNQRIYGVQGVDWVHRMQPQWGQFINEAEKMLKDGIILQYLNKNTIEKALHSASQGARAENHTDPNYKVLMRSIIVHRYIKKHFERR